MTRSSNPRRRQLALVLTGAAAIGSLSAASGFAQAAASGPPSSITASPITRMAGTLAPGTTVRSSSIQTRVFVNASDGFALAAGTSAQYPAATTDGGKTWRTDGPALHVDAAQAPLSVLDVGAAGTHTFYAYGGGQVVDATNDGGKHWWRAVLGDEVSAVVPGFDHQLFAFVQNAVGSSSSRAETVVYVSKDGGHHWRLTNGFAA